MWVSNVNGDYVNLDAVTLLTVVQSGSNWRISGPTGQWILGVFTTQADAQDALRELVHGVDPSTLI